LLRFWQTLHSDRHFLVQKETFRFSVAAAVAVVVVAVVVVAVAAVVEMSVQGTLNFFGSVLGWQQKYYCMPLAS